MLPQCVERHAPCLEQQQNLPGWATRVGCPLWTKSLSTAIPSPVQPAIQETGRSLCDGRLQADVCLSTAHLVAEVCSVCPMKWLLESRPTSAWTEQAVCLTLVFLIRARKEDRKGLHDLKSSFHLWILPLPQIFSMELKPKMLVLGTLRRRKT